MRSILCEPRTETELEKAVENGISALERVNKDWWRDVLGKPVDMNCNRGCIASRATKQEYQAALRELGIEDGIDYGFDVNPAEDVEHFDELARIWQEKAKAASAA